MSRLKNRLEELYTGGHKHPCMKELMKIAGGEEVNNEEEKVGFFRRIIRYFIKLK